MTVADDQLALSAPEPRDRTTRVSLLLASTAASLTTYAGLQLRASGSSTEAMRWLGHQTEINFFRELNGLRPYASSAVNGAAALAAELFLVF